MIDYSHFYSNLHSHAPAAFACYLASFGSDEERLELFSRHPDRADLISVDSSEMIHTVLSSFDTDAGRLKLLQPPLIDDWRSDPLLHAWVRAHCDFLKVSDRFKNAIFSTFDDPTCCLKALSFKNQLGETVWSLLPEDSELKAYFQSLEGQSSQSDRGIPKKEIKAFKHALKRYHFDPPTETFEQALKTLSNMHSLREELWSVTNWLNACADSVSGWDDPIPLEDILKARAALEHEIYFDEVSNGQGLTPQQRLKRELDAFKHQLLRAVFEFDADAVLQDAEQRARCQATFKDVLQGLAYEKKLDFVLNVEWSLFRFFGTRDKPALPRLDSPFYDHPDFLEIYLKSMASDEERLGMFKAKKIDGSGFLLSFDYFPLKTACLDKALFEIMLSSMDTIESRRKLLTSLVEDVTRCVPGTTLLEYWCCAGGNDAQIKEAIEMARGYLQEDLSKPSSLVEEGLGAKALRYAVLREDLLGYLLSLYGDNCSQKMDALLTSFPHHEPSTFHRALHMKIYPGYYGVSQHTAQAIWTILEWHTRIQLRFDRSKKALVLRHPSNLYTERQLDAMKQAMDAVKGDREPEQFEAACSGQVRALLSGTPANQGFFSRVSTAVQGLLFPSDVSIRFENQSP